MVSNAGLGKEFWAEALLYVSHLINKLSATGNEVKTLLDVQSGHSAIDYDHLYVFGCHIYYYVWESKLDSGAKKTIFLGFSSNVKGFRLWCIESKKIYSIVETYLKVIEIIVVPCNWWSLRLSL